MSNMSGGLDVASVLAGFDRSSSDNLLVSLAREIVRLNRAHADLSARMHTLEQWLEISDRLLAAHGLMETAKLPLSALVDATHSMLDSNNFYGLEFDSSGRAYRWTGPAADFSVQFFLNRLHGGNFSLHFSSLIGGASPENIQCLVDGVPVAAELGSEGTGYVLTGKLPPRPDAGASLLTFVLPSTASPAQLGLSGDSRQLGLSFQSLSAVANNPDDAAPADITPISALPKPGKKTKRAE